MNWKYDLSSTSPEALPLTSIPISRSVTYDINIKRAMWICACTRYQPNSRISNLLDRKSSSGQNWKGFEFEPRFNRAFLTFVLPFLVRSFSIDGVSMSMVFWKLDNFC